VAPRSRGPTGRRDLARTSRAASVGSNDVWIALLRHHDVDAVRLYDRGGFNGRENAEVDRRSIGKEIPIVERSCEATA